MLSPYHTAENSVVADNFSGQLATYYATEIVQRKGRLGRDIDLFPSSVAEAFRGGGGLAKADKREALPLTLFSAFLGQLDISHSLTKIWN